MTSTRVIFVEVEGVRREVSVGPEKDGATLADVLRRAGLPLNTRCAGRGLCEGCSVELLGGELAIPGGGTVRAPEGKGPEPGAASGLPGGMLRACQLAVGEQGGAVVRVPGRSLVAYEPKVVTDFRLNVRAGCDPLWRQIEIDVPAGAAGDPESLGESAAAKLCSGWLVSVGDGVAEAAARFAGRRAWATMERTGLGWVLTELRDRPVDGSLGLAIDIGTTTVVVMLVELSTGAILSRSAEFNHQVQLGDDVLTRINLCTTDPSALGRLQEAVVGQTIVPLLREALEQAQAGAERVKCAAVAGNTTMLHLLAGVDPSSMGVAPFTPVFLEHRVLRAGDLRGWPGDLPGELALHLLPGAAAYVGSDLTSGAVATGLRYDDGPSLLVDVGTNGEIILKHGAHLVGCSTAAGPAFEGAGLSSGMRAGEGAIDHVRLTTARARDGDGVELGIIGHDADEPLARRKARGLCGSAYIDFLAEGRRAEVLNEVGRYQPAPAGPWAGRIAPCPGGGLTFELAGVRGKRPIGISEADVARLMQAKAAIAAGVLTLLARQHLRPEDVKTVYLAGGFGTHLVVENAIACGLLPGFEPRQVQVVGNTALAGAYLALLDGTALDEIGRVGRGLKAVELNLDPGFEERFIEQLMLP